MSRLVAFFNDGGVEARDDIASDCGAADGFARDGVGCTLKSSVDMAYHGWIPRPVHAPRREGCPLSVL